ncbi:MAG: 50S ribosomal protein L31 [Chloroflexi bacterium]|nr:50S ribosomal protein L31 [Chloroflexota bacterium]
MKSGIHPQFVEATVTCACGNTFKTLSIKPTIRIEVCSHCHPFFTGEQRIVDTAGQVERFMRRTGVKEQIEAQAARNRAEKEAARLKVREEKLARRGLRSVRLHAAEGVLADMAAEAEVGDDKAETEVMPSEESPGG